MEDTLLPTVAVVSAGPLDPEMPCLAVDRLLGCLGGMTAYVERGQEVLLLVNLRRTGVLSYLCLVAGIAGLVQRAGGRVAIGDSPWLTTESVEKHWRAHGLDRLAKHREWRLLDFQKEPLQAMAVRAHVYHIPRVVMTAPVVINIAPVMRHATCVLAAGIFNLFGALPGYKPGQYPENRDDPRMVCEVSVDLLSVIHPSLTILDASPVSRHTEVASDCRRRLLASTDTVAADCIAAANLGLEPGAVPTIRVSSEAGLGIGWPEGIEQVGDAGYPLQLSNLARFEADPRLRLPSWLRRFSSRLVSYRPVVDTRSCRPCSDCSDACPTGALRFDAAADQLAYSPSRCISCFRCISGCPRGALSVRSSWLASQIA